MVGFLTTPHQHYFNPFANIFNPLEEVCDGAFRSQPLRQRISATVLALWGMPGLPIQDVLPSRSGVLDYLTVLPVVTHALFEVIKSPSASQRAKGFAYAGLALLALPVFALTIANTIVAALFTLMLSPLLALVHFCIKKKNKWDFAKVHEAAKLHPDESEEKSCCSLKSISILARVAQPKPKVATTVTPPIILRELPKDFIPELPPAGRVEGVSNSSGRPSI